jgi:hypothetical protein
VIMALHDSLLLVAMPLWIVTRTKAPLPLTGLLFALNTVLVVLLQVRTTRNIAARGGITRGYRTAAVSFVFACGAFAVAAGAPAVAATVLLVFALGALTSAELVTSAGEWFLSVNLAPARGRERYLSVQDLYGCAAGGRAAARHHRPHRLGEARLARARVPAGRRHPRKPPSCCTRDRPPPLAHGNHTAPADARCRSPASCRRSS